MWARRLISAKGVLSSFSRARLRPFPLFRLGAAAAFTGGALVALSRRQALAEEAKAEPVPKPSGAPTEPVEKTEAADFKSISITEPNAATYEALILKAPQHVFLEIYADDCPHCAMMAPVVEQVAYALALDSEVMVAKFETNKNKISTEILEEKYINASPWLVYYPAGEKSKPIDLKPSPTAEMILKDLHERTGGSFDLERALKRASQLDDKLEQRVLAQAAKNADEDPVSAYIKDSPCGAELTRMHVVFSAAKHITDDATSRLYKEASEAMNQCYAQKKDEALAFWLSRTNQLKEKLAASESILKLFDIFENKKKPKKGDKKKKKKAKKMKQAEAAPAAPAAAAEPVEVPAVEAPAPAPEPVSEPAAPVEEASAPESPAPVKEKKKKKQGTKKTKKAKKAAVEPTPEPTPAPAAEEAAPPAEPAAPAPEEPAQPVKAKKTKKMKKVKKANKVVEAAAAAAAAPEPTPAPEPASAEPIPAAEEPAPAPAASESVVEAVKPKKLKKKGTKKTKKSKAVAAAEPVAVAAVAEPEPEPTPAAEAEPVQKKARAPVPEPIEPAAPVESVSVPEPEPEPTPAVAAPAEPEPVTVVEPVSAPETKKKSKNNKDGKKKKNKDGKKKKNAKKLQIEVPAADPVPELSDLSPRSNRIFHSQQQQHLSGAFVPNKRPRKPVPQSDFEQTFGISLQDIPVSRS